MSEENKDFIPPKVAKPGGISPAEVNKEPPSEILKQTFSIDPSIKMNNDDQRVMTEDKYGKTTSLKIEQPGEKKDEVKETVEKKEEKKVDTDKGEQRDKAEDKKDTKVETKEETSKLPSYLKPPKGKEGVKIEDKKEGKQRDYTGFTDEEQKILKQTSNEAFDFVRDTIKQNKELKTNQLYQHPQGFILDPEFQNLRTQAINAQNERQIWLDTLTKVTKGEKVKLLKEWDKDGNPVYTGEVEPNQQLEESIRAGIAKCDRVIDERLGTLNQFPTQYQQRIIQDHQAIQTERSKRFPWVANKDLLDYTLTITNDKGEQIERSINDIRNDIISLFPLYMRHGPVAETLGDLTVSLIMAQIELQEAKKGQQVAEIKREELQRGEPSSQNKPVPENNGKVGKVTEFKIEPGLSLTGIR